MEYLRTLVAAISVLFATTAPVMNVDLSREQAKADTAAMVTYATLADGVLVTEPAKARCLVFYFDGCPPCEQVHRTIDKELVPNGWSAGNKATDDFEYINVYGRDERLAKYRNGRGWMCPTLVIIDSKGKELDRHVGALSAKQLTDWLGKFRNP